MENTGNVLFTDPKDQTPQWFIAIGKSWVGPLSAADVYAKVIAKEISWAHFIWKNGQKNWQRVCDTEPFVTAVPREPSKVIKDQVAERSREITAAGKAQAKKGPPAPPPKDDGEDDQQEKIWYLYFNESQYGPFSTQEVEENLASGKINERVHCWRDGMPGWERLEKVDAFKKKLRSGGPVVQPAVLRSTRAKTEKVDKRGTPRKPMVARILLSNDQELAVAMCRDISIGGMQVLTDKIPGEVGGKIKLNVSPALDKDDKTKSDFKPFVAEGTIVRLLEDGRGFSFRFDRLTDSARRSIENYLQAGK